MSTLDQYKPLNEAVNLGQFGSNVIQHVNIYHNVISVLEQFSEDPSHTPEVNMLVGDIIAQIRIIIAAKTQLLELISRLQVRTIKVPSNRLISRAIDRLKRFG